MAGGSGGNDFFLKFGSNAESFAANLTGQVEPGRRAIQGLIDELENFDDQMASSSRTKNPLGRNLLDSLNQAGDKFEALGKGLIDQLQGAMTAISGIATVVADLSANMNKIQRAQEKTRAAGVSSVTDSDVEVSSARARAKRRGVAQAEQDNQTGSSTARANRSLERHNQLTSTQASTTTRAADSLKGLNAQLRELLQISSDRGKALKGLKDGEQANGGTAVFRNATGDVQISNSTANPVPVIIVGAGGATSTPHGAPKGPQPTAVATTATQQAAVERELGNSANSRKNPSRIGLGDTVSPGQYFLLPGDDEKKPRRASNGVRPGETAGQYVSRVEAQASREQDAKSAVPGGLSAEETALLNKFRRTGGRTADRLERETGQTSGSVSGGGKAKKGSTANPAYNGRVANPEESGSGASPTGGREPFLSTPAAPRNVLSRGALDDDEATKIGGILDRNQEFQARLRDRMREFVAQELRNDPHMTQDGLGADAKAALKRMDEAMLDPAASPKLFEKFFGDDVPDVDELKQGATRRRYIAEHGASVFEEGAQRRYIRQGNWESGGGMEGVEAKAKLAAQSQQEIDELNAQRGTDAGKEKARQDRVRNAAARSRRAADLNASLNDPTIDPLNLKNREQAYGQLRAASAPFVSELDAKIRRTQQSADRNAASNKPELVARNQARIAELQAQRSELVPGRPEGATNDTPPMFEEMRRVASVLERLAAERLANAVVDDPRPAAAGSEPEPVIAQPAGGKPRRTRQARKPAAGVTEAQAQAAVEPVNEPDPIEQINQAVSEVARVKEQLKGVNQKITALRTRRERTKDGSKNQQNIDAKIEGLEQEKTELRQEQTRLNRSAANERRRNARAGAGGGGGTTPPGPPAPPAAGSAPEPDPDPDPTPTVRAAIRANVLNGGRALRTTDAALTPDQQTRFSNLAQETQDALEEAKAELSRNGATRAEQDQAVGRAGAAFKQDPAFRTQFSDAGDRARSFSRFVGLDPTQRGVRTYVRDQVLSGGGLADDYAQANRVHAAGALGPNGQPAAGSPDQSARVARVDGILATSSGRLREARLAEFIAEERLQHIRQDAAATAEQVARAEIALSSASRATATAREAASAQANQNRYQAITGRNSSFGRDLLRHGSYALENTIGYSVVFTGFEKLREVVHTGIEADVAFVRLQASLDANGVAAGDLRSQLAQISATTATPLEHIIEAASELAGVFKDSGDLDFATNIAAQLANISQGTLDAKEAAIGLRDVTVAYGLTGKDQIQAVGDEIAHLSQLTGVSIEDITKGTTQIAQEAHEFKLTQRQAATIAAYVTQGTGQSGEEAASQTSRLLATMYNGRTQNQLVRAGVATPDDFATGKIGEVLQKLIGRWKSLNDAQRQAIASLMGTGIQARAFAALMNGGAEAVAEMNSELNDTGALGRQNQAFLDTVAGSIKQLDEDFQNLGSTLARLGAFDAIGILAKSLDQLFKTFNQTFGAFASIMDSNPITKGIMHWSVILLEAAAAWKIFGGAATTALAKMGVLNLAPRNAAAIAQARQAGTALPAPQYDRVAFRTAAGAVGGRLSTVPGRLETRFANYGAANPGALASSIGYGGFRSGAPGIFPGARAALSNLFTNPNAGRYGVTGGLIGPMANPNPGYGERGGLIGPARGPGFGQTGGMIGPPTRVQAEAIASMNGLSAATATAATRLRAFGAGMAASLGGLAASMGLMAGVLFAFTAISAARQNAAERSEAADNILANGAADPKGLSKLQQPQSFRDWYAGPGQLFGLKPTLAALTPKIPYLTSGLSNYGNSVGLPSDESSDRATALMSQNYRDYKVEVPKLKTVDAVKEWLAGTEFAIEEQREDIQKAGGNDENAQAQIAYSIDRVKQTLQTAALKRIASLNGLKEVDVLNASQVQLMMQSLGAISSFSGNTLRTQTPAIKSLLDNSSVPQGSAAYDALLGATGLVPQPKPTVKKNLYYGGSLPAKAGPDVVPEATPDFKPTTSQSRLESQSAGYQSAIDNATSIIQAAGDEGGAGVGTPVYQQALQDLQSALMAQQQVQQAVMQNPISVSQGQASYYQSIGGTTPGGDESAIQNLQQANQQILAYNQTLDYTEPQYWANLAQIQQNKAAIAQLVKSPQMQALQIAAASTVDATSSANIAYQQAVLQLQQDQAGGASSTTIAADQAAIAQRGIGIAQANQGVREAEAGVNVASVRNEVGKAQEQLNSALQKQQAYRSGSLRDRASYLQAVQEEITARQAIADAIQAEAQSTYDVTSAYQKLRGDNVGAAQTELTKANEAYRYAVETYGAQSQQANQAMAATVQAQQALSSAALAQLNSSVDLQIAQANARGKEGDIPRAAQLAVQKAQNALNEYTSRGGSVGTEEYNNLAATLATAQRTAFDTALQAQLDTLDFQRETYQITSSQEVQALQQILQNKQLTLQEQRDITLKIKNLQAGIRQQLTEGGMNIPSGIILPTGYEVRRSLGASAAAAQSGTAAAMSQVNSNNTNVQIHNNVTTEAQAREIANQVITMINQQTGAQARGSTSTPRLVSTR